MAGPCAQRGGPQTVDDDDDDAFDRAEARADSPRQERSTELGRTAARLSRVVNAAGSMGGIRPSLS